jgi:large subunit ribosomal protein L10
LKEVAALPSREVMLGRMLAGVKSPLYGLAGTLQGIQRKLVYALNAVKEAKAEQGG